MEFEIRRFELKDADSVVYYANNELIAEKLRDVFPYPYTLSDAENFIADIYCSDETKDFCRAVAVDGEVVGCVSIYIQDDVYRRSGELGYWLGEPFWGNGIMPRAVMHMCKIAFKKYALERIYAQPFADNLASRSVLEKCGFTLEGIMRSSVYKNGVFKDSCMYSLLREEFIKTK